MTDAKAADGDRNGRNGETLHTLAPSRFDGAADGDRNGRNGEGAARARHFLIDALPESDRSSALDTCNMIKNNRAIGAPYHPGHDAVRILERVSEAYELAATDQWPGPTADSENKNFRQTCAECFALMEGCRIPSDPVQMIGHVLRAVSYAYMGEKREDARRYAREAAPPPPGDGVDLPGGWERRILFGIYGSRLAIAKERPGDLAKASGVIADLRRDQAVREKPYFESLEPEFRAAAARSLVSLYHLAKCTDLVCKYMEKGSPTDVEARLDYHFDQALRHSGAGGAGSAELDVLIRIVRPMFAKMVSNPTGPV